MCFFGTIIACSYTLIPWIANFSAIAPKLSKQLNGAVKIIVILFHPEIVAKNCKKYCLSMVATLNLSSDCGVFIVFPDPKKIVKLPIGKYFPNTLYLPLIIAACHPL